jgi:hypothetical protein
MISSDNLPYIKFGITCLRRYISKICTNETEVIKNFPVKLFQVMFKIAKANSEETNLIVILILLYH